MKRLLLIAGVGLIAATALVSCGKKSEANKEQIENARQEAEDMTKGFDASKSMKPAQGKVKFDTSGVTEIVVSEEPAPESK